MNSTILCMMAYIFTMACIFGASLIGATQAVNPPKAMMGLLFLGGINLIAVGTIFHRLIQRNS